MWDPDQRAEIPVIIDQLQVRGDPLGEWLALRQHMEAGDLPRAERKILRRRVRRLREQLGPSLTLADDPQLGRPHVIRELGLIADVSFPAATPARVAALLARADAPFVLRLRLRGQHEGLLACVDLLRARDEGRGGSRTWAHLRELALEPVDDAGEHDRDGALALRRELEAQREELGVELPSLFALSVGDAPLSLAFDRGMLDQSGSWTPALRVALGRALASEAPEQRQAALEQLGTYGVDAEQLRAPLVAILVGDPCPEVRAAALSIVPQLGELAHTISVLAAQAARERDDPQR